MADERMAVVADQHGWMEKLRQEIADAHREWENANRFFDYAEGPDQVDYAIFALISAEKRYQMLLRLAKRTGSKWPEWRGSFK